MAWDPIPMRSHRQRCPRRIAATGISLALLAATACGATGDGARAPADPPTAGVTQTASHSTARFGFDLFRGLTAAAPDENVVTSPFSAAVLLTMLLNGADGETRQAIGEVLHLQDPFDPGINAGYHALAAYLTAADPDVELRIANSLWANQGTPFEDAYMETVREAFDAELRELDLGSPAAVEAIDGWVSEQTGGRIEEMAEDLGVPDGNLVLILLNAVYFLGNWTEPFDPERTETGPFTRPDGSAVQVPLMSRDDMIPFSAQEGFQVVRLSYGDTKRLGMEIFLPDEGVSLEELRQRLDAGQWTRAVADLSETRVQVTLPRFELEYDSGDELDRVLQDLGMEIAYTGAADFTPMSPRAPWLDTVRQKAFIRVDETGTEAAAATGGAMLESLPPQFRADRPFVFTISDAETGTVLFLGQVTDPSGSS